MGGERMPKYLQSASIHRFFEQGQPLTYGKGDVIVGNHALPDKVYFIGAGFVKTYSISDDGDEYIHLISGQGEIFPLLWAYLHDIPDSLFYEAISTTTVWRVAQDVFIRHLKTDHGFCFDMSMQLANQAQIFNERVDNLEYKKAGERVIYRLLFLASRFGVRENGIITIEAPITHELFASTINLARESVSREFERLEELRLVKRVNHQICIIDFQKLSDQLSRPANFSNWKL
jgi:CRP-like cAMP-binding protein